MIHLYKRAKEKAPNITPVTISLVDINNYTHEVWQYPFKVLWLLATTFRLEKFDFGDDLNLVDGEGEIYHHQRMTGRRDE